MRFTASLVLGACLAGAVQADPWTRLAALAGPDDLVEVSRVRLEGRVDEPRGLAKAEGLFWLASTRRGAKGSVCVLRAFDAAGNRKHELTVGDPGRGLAGGIASDGERLWIPCRPDQGNATVVHEVHARRLTTRTAFVSPEPISALGRDGSGVLHAAVHGSRRRLALGGTGRVLSAWEDGFHLLDEVREIETLSDRRLAVFGPVRLTGAVRGVLGHLETAGMGVVERQSGYQLVMLFSKLTEKGRPALGGAVHLEAVGGSFQLHSVADSDEAWRISFGPR